MSSSEPTNLLVSIQPSLGTVPKPLGSFQGRLISAKIVVWNFLADIFLNLGFTWASMKCFSNLNDIRISLQTHGDDPRIRKITDIFRKQLIIPVFGAVETVTGQDILQRLSLQKENQEELQKLVFLQEFALWKEKALNFLRMQYFLNLSSPKDCIEKLLQCYWSLRGQVGDNIAQEWLIEFLPKIVSEKMKNEFLPEVEKTIRGNKIHLELPFLENIKKRYSSDNTVS